MSIQNFLAINKFKKYSLKFLRILAYIIVSIFTFVLVIFAAIQIPRVQEYLSQRAENFLEKKTNTKVELDAIYLTIPTNLVVKGLYIEDQLQDTLVYLGKLNINIDMIALLSSEINVDELGLYETRANLIKSGPDSTFNFQFIVDSFAQSDTTQAQEELAKADTSQNQSNWTFSIDDVVLEDIRFNFQDSIGGTYMQYLVGRLDVDLGESDLQHMNFQINKLNLENSEGYYTMTQYTPPDTLVEEDTTSFELVIQQISLDNVLFKLNDSIYQQEMVFDIGKIEVDAQEFSLAKQVAAINNLLLENSSYTYYKKALTTADSLRIAEIAADTVSKVEDDEKDQAAWRVTANKADLNKNQFTYIDYNEEYNPGSIDFDHLVVTDIDLALRQIMYHGIKLEAGIAEFSFKEQSGFELQELSGMVSMDSTAAGITDFVFATPNSEIKRSIELQYPSLEQISDIKQLQMDINLRDSRLCSRDLNYIIPDFASMLPNPGILPFTVDFDAVMSGSVQRMQINRLFARTLNDTRLFVEGVVGNVMNPENIYADIEQSLTTSESDLRKLVLSDTVAFDLPGEITLNSEIRGRRENLEADVQLSTSQGNIQMDASTSPGEQFQVEATINQLELGHILENDSLFGQVTGNISAEGENFDLEQLVASFQVQLDSIGFNQYQYEDLNLEGKLAQQVFNGDINYKDDNLHFDFDGTASLNPEDLLYDFSLDLKGADLQALNFSQDNIVVSGNFVSNLTGVSLNNLNGDVGIRDVIVVKEGKSYRMDSLVFISFTEEESSDLSINSDFFDAEFKGTINLADLAPALKSHINQYYDLQDPDIDAPIQNQNFEFNIDLKNPELLTEVLVPSLNEFVPGSIEGDFNSTAGELNINILIPEAEFGGIGIDTLTFFVNSDTTQLNYAMSVARIGLGQYKIENFAIVGQVADNVIESRFQITNEDRKTQYTLGGEFASVENGFQFKPDTSQILLNYNKWQLPGDASILIGDRPLFIQNFRLHRDQKELEFTTKMDGADSTLVAGIKNFNLRTLTALLEADSEVLRGTTNGVFNLGLNPDDQFFTSDITIDSLAVLNSRLGTLNIMASSEASNQIDLEVMLEGNGNDLEVVGDIGSEDGNTVLNLTLNMNNLNLETLRGPLQGVLSDLSGGLEGQIYVGGTMPQLDIDGGLDFKKANFVVDNLGSQFTIDNETLQFTNEGIVINQFEVTDVNNNVATIDGTVFTTNYQNLRFDLNISTNDFTALNSEKTKDALYYGLVVIDSDIQVTGNMTTPVVDMSVNVQEETNLIYIVPKGDVVAAEYEGIVRFIDVQEAVSEIIARAQNQEIDTATSKFTGMDLNANIEIEPGVQLKVVIDNVAGDFLTVTAASSDLSLAIDPLGNINLTGIYEIQDGKYQLTFYDIIRRSFDLQEGSTIQWTGNPLDANINITAAYTVEVNPPKAVATSGTEKVPVSVLLNMQGELMSPLITFDLEVPPGTTGELATNLSNYLQSQVVTQENELNKQVFSLLVLQRFLENDPFAGGGGGIAGSARSSVSSFLTQQLNNLSANIKGVDLSFDLESYEDQEGEGSLVGRTQLEVALSKNLLNDRLRVKVGGNLELQGTQQGAQTQQTNFSDYLGDILIEYLLTEDGRLRLEFFRRDDYEALNEAYIIETGTGIIFQRDYNRFSNLFTKPEELEEEE